MKFIVQVVIIAALAFGSELFFPWWTMAIAAFIGGAVFNTRANFGAGFLAIVLLWLVKALSIEVGAAAPLAERVAKLFMLSKPLLFALTCLLGGLVGGFAAMAGGALHKGKRKSSYY
jgi:hypothetical protein